MMRWEVDLNMGANGFHGLSAHVSPGVLSSWPHPHPLYSNTVGVRVFPGQKAGIPLRAHWLGTQTIPTV